MSLHSEAVCDHVVGACQEAREVMVVFKDLHVCSFFMI